MGVVDCKRTRPQNFRVTDLRDIEMTTETADTPEEENPADEGGAVAATMEGSEPETDAPVTDAASVPEFAETQERVVRRLDASTDRLRGVSVPVWAELGRVEMLIGDLLELGEGSVVRLDRAVGDPVDLVSQGVKLARGEVIVVDDCFAIRIREILSGN